MNGCPCTARLLALACCFYFSLTAFAQKEDWLPVTGQDLRLREVPGDPEAPAIQLYFADSINDEEQTEFFYHRIKILRDEGGRFADVSITVPPEGTISGLKARTIHPDGSIVEFTGRPFDKLIIKSRGMKVLAKVFTLPDVTVNSIIEYKYTLNWPDVSLDNFWTIQHELFTVKESFRMKPYGGVLEGLEKGHQVAALSSRMPGGVKPRQSGGGYELVLENVPAFAPEGFMPPKENYQPWVRFFYGGQEITNADRFWQDAGRRWNEEAEHFIGNHPQVRLEAQRIAGRDTSPMQKLQRLYQRAQQTRNLSYERERSEEEKRREDLKPNQNIGEVLAHGYGDHDEITRLFAGLARASGFDVYIVRVSNRKENFFDRDLLSRRQLDTEIAMVALNGQNIFLDPGTRFCPFELVRWMHTSSLALKLDKKGGTFIKVPSLAYDKAVVRRNANMELQANGALRGTITVAFEGGEALERRLDALATDEAGKKESLEAEIQSWLPAGASATLVSAGGGESSDAPLVATFHVDVPAYATVSGKRLLVPGYIFQDKKVDAFKASTRKYPVYFPYAFGESDTVSIEAPPGYIIANAGAPLSANLAYATYENSSLIMGRQLVTHRTLQVNGIFVQPEEYAAMKEFFRQVQAGDEQQVVLHLGEESTGGMDHSTAG